MDAWILNSGIRDVKKRVQTGVGTLVDDVNLDSAPKQEDADGCLDSE